MHLVIHSGESLYSVDAGGKKSIVINGLSSRTVSGIPGIRVILFQNVIMTPVPT